MWTRFEKWQGTGNDFIITWNDLAIKDSFNAKLAGLAPNLCLRSGTGIGADGLLNIFYSPEHINNPLHLSIINSDGSFAVTCGNGLRVAALAARRFREGMGMADDKNKSQDFVLKGGRLVSCYVESMEFPRGFVTVDMGYAKINLQNSWHTAAIDQAHAIANSLGLGSRIKNCYTCEIGNNHIVIFVDGASADLARILGPALQNIGGLDGINVHIVHKDSEKVSSSNNIPETLRDRLTPHTYITHTWERGAGLTGACGSGACSVGLVSQDLDPKAENFWSVIKMPGGFLYVKVDRRQQGNGAILSGEGKFVYAGKFLTDG